MKTFLKWYAFENNLKDWDNPIDKVKVKNPADQPLDPVDIKAVKVILSTYRQSFVDIRDRVIISMLLDTGMRISELLALVHENINPTTCVIQILYGKRGKIRTVYVGKKTRIAPRRYIVRTSKKGVYLWRASNLYDYKRYVEVEANIYGIPAVCSALDGHFEAAGDDQLLIAPNDLNAWISYLNLLLRNRKIYQKYKRDTINNASRFVNCNSLNILNELVKYH